MSATSPKENEKKRVRSPIAVVLGHVDSGKTSLLDSVRGTAVQAREAGGITQHVGASFFPAETIIKAAEPVAKALNIKVELKIPGLLIIDTPGHAAFVNLRARGASVADIAILVVDITRGFQAQTYESLDILRQRKTPFIVALNKIDRLPGWSANPGESFLSTIKKQNKRTQQELENKIYEVQGELSSLGLPAERYDRIKDYTKFVAVVPVSAHTKEGIPDLFLILSGITQQYMMKRLRYSEGPGKGVVLEVREEEGMGTTLDIVLYDGVLKKDDTVVFATKQGAKTSRVKALLLPKPLDEMRDPRDKFTRVDEIYASAGVKLLLQEPEGALAGAPIFVAVNKEEEKKLSLEIEEELRSLRIDTEEEGIILKADTLGSLEALVGMLKSHGIPIRKADVGDISKRDVMEALITAEKLPQYGAILGFNVGFQGEAEEEAYLQGLPVFLGNIIYHVIDEYLAWKAETEEKERSQVLADLQRPGKIKILPNYVFRISKPAVVGVEVLEGMITPRNILIREDNKRVGTIQQIQENRQNIDKATKGKQVAISIKGPTVGRQIKEGMILYTDIRGRDARLLLTKYKEQLEPGELELLDEIVKIKQRAGNRYWPFA